MPEVPLTTDEARRHREFCEAAILRQLHELQKITGLDIARVEVLVIVEAELHEEPKRVPFSVRIDLAV
jgi:hypothetical protein